MYTNVYMRPYARVAIILFYIFTGLKSKMAHLNDEPLCLKDKYVPENNSWDLNYKYSNNILMLQANGHIFYICSFICYNLDMY